MNIGKVYAVIPYDSTKIASANRNDIWDTYVKINPKLELQLPILNNVLFYKLNVKENTKDILNFLNMTFGDLYSKYSTEEQYMPFVACWASFTLTYAGINKSLSQSDIQKVNPIIYSHINENYELIQNIKLYDILNYYLSPAKLLYSIVKYDVTLKKNNNEIWLDSPAIIVSLNTLQYLQDND